VTDPVLHVLAGPNGAGKTTFYQRVLAPVTHLRFVNADLIAAEVWPGDPVAHAYDAAQRAAAERVKLIGERVSFVTETVFSHPSKLNLLTSARDAGYQVTLHVVAIPVELAVARVTERVRHGGHDVPEQKIRDRYERLWTHVAAAIAMVGEAAVYDNSRAARPYRLLARHLNGRLLADPDWPAWTPLPLRTAGC